MRTHKNIIVTLQYNKFELTNRLLLGLAKHESENIDEVVIVDNGSLDVDFNKLIELSMSARSFLVTIFSKEKNEGFTLGANYGLQKVFNWTEERDIIFLISNDVEINGGFIKQAEEHLLSPNPVLVGNRHINRNSGWNFFGGMVFDYLEGYFLATTKWGWAELGMFDPNYAPCDFEDVDLTTKAKQKGYKIVSLNNPNIVHAGAGTYGYNPEREVITKRNQVYFKNKWVK